MSQPSENIWPYSLLIPNIREGGRLRRKGRIMSFTVVRVISGDTFEVSPNWNWNDQTGRAVKTNGYDAPMQGEPGFEAAKEKLEKLLLNEQVKLTELLKLPSGRLLADVKYIGLNLTDYFFEYKIT
jgi:endonuclease YncB( thermonuclease family)